MPRLAPICGVALSEAPPQSGEGGLCVPQLAQWVVQISHSGACWGGSVKGLVGIAKRRSVGLLHGAAEGIGWVSVGCVIYWRMWDEERG